MLKVTKVAKVTKVVGMATISPLLPATARPGPLVADEFLHWKRIEIAPITD